MSSFTVNIWHYTPQGSSDGLPSCTICTWLLDNEEVIIYGEYFASQTHIASMSLSALPDMWLCSKHQLHFNEYYWSKSTSLAGGQRTQHKGEILLVRNNFSHPAHKLTPFNFVPAHTLMPFQFIPTLLQACVRLTTKYDVHNNRSIGVVMTMNVLSSSK